MPRTILIDTDTAADDAVALIMALATPDVRVAAITTVAGNVDLAQATKNALYTVELCQSDVRVHQGSDAPLERAYFGASHFLGKNGFGDQDFRPSRLHADPVPAVDAIIASALANDGLELVTLGPLTNIAKAVRRQPAIVERIKRCVLMAGAYSGPGNVTPVSEFNIWVDPEAARIVMHSGLPLEMVGLHLSRGDAVLSSDEIADLVALGTGRAEFAVECNRRARQSFREITGIDGLSLPDAVAMAVALDRSIGTRWSKHFVDVETKGELTRGMTVVDKLGIVGNDYTRAAWQELLTRGPNVDVCWQIDVGRWKAVLKAALSKN